MYAIFFGIYVYWFSFGSVCSLVCSLVLVLFLAKEGLDEGVESGILLSVEFGSAGT